MVNEKSTEFIPREVVANPLRIFEAGVNKINNSIIAFGYGTHEDGSPNAIGTGFNVVNLDDEVGLFATCLHVMESIVRIRDFSPTELEDEGLVDRKRRVAFLNNNRYEWTEVDRIKFSDKIQINGGNFVKTHDVCICHIPGIVLPSLSLSPDEYFMGSELGIVGFPNFEHLQRLSVQPYAIKTILSSHMIYPFEIDYVFNFDEVPGMDNGRFIDFLGFRFGIDWSKHKKIEKIDDIAITVSTETKSLSLSLNEGKTETILKIDDGRTSKFRAEMDAGMLTIHEVIASKRIALDCTAGEGFSGSPVFSVRDGRIVGMVDYVPAETYLEDLKIIGPMPREADVRVHSAAGISFAVPSYLIQKCLEYALMGDWETPGNQIISRM